MFNIRNKYDLKDAYILLRFLEEDGRFEDSVKEIKQDIRKYHKSKPENPCIVLVKDYGIDGYIERYPAPDRCETIEDVDEWFMDTEWIHIIPSQYDCTGQLFTCWYKPAFLRGRWYVYHSVACDC